MTLRIAGIGFLLAWGCLAADGPEGFVQGGNENLEIRANLYKDHDAVQKLLGEEIEKGIVVVDVEVTPKGGEPLSVWHDDFILRSDKDGEKSEPYDPGQIASNYVITLVYTYDGGGVSQEDNGPVWGGIGGRPQRLPGTGAGAGNAGGVERPSGTRVGKTSKNPHDELLAVLESKILKETETTEPVHGLLYFPLDGKHKTKQIWLHYVGDAGKLDLRFKPRK